VRGVEPLRPKEKKKKKKEEKNGGGGQIVRSESKK
jgi:hypothetical protein